MRLGFSTVMYEGTNLTHPEIIGKAATLGYEGIELNFKEWPSELNLDEIEESMNRFDVKIAAIGTRHMYVTHGLYLSSPHKDVRKRALAYITECMKISRRLGCSIVQAGWAFQGSRLEAPFPAAWRQAVESLKEVGRRALDCGLLFVIEFACKQNAELVNTMDDALLMLDEVGCENVLVMADIFHIYMEKGPLRETILKGGKRLGYVHLADSDRLTPGRGRIDFQELINALKEINYKGYMIMEFNPDPSADESLEQAIQYVMKLL
ncbi:MAG: sugar phosphate isomerase/epimerase family protein [Candidatus Bathyarchaeia archaeon]